SSTSGACKRGRTSCSISRRSWWAGCLCALLFIDGPFIDHGRFIDGLFIERAAIEGRLPSAALSERCMGELTANGYPRFSPAERRALEQYVVRYAEPESAYGSALPGSFAAAVVAPLCAEEPTSVLRLARELAAAESVAAWRNLPILLIAVVNGRTDAPAEVHAANAALLDVCRTSAKGVRGLAPPGRARAGRAPARAEWLCFDESFEDDAVSVLLLDAATDPQRFPRKQGVGLARKIGCDVAVALSLAGRLKA